MAGDVYAHPMHVGRGGWSWYTGSAGWMYQAAVQAMLGLKRNGRTVTLDPCVPTVWSEFTVEWRVDSTRYRFVVSNPEYRSNGIVSALHDGEPVDPAAIPLVSDGGVHEVRIQLGAGASADLMSNRLSAT